VSEEEEKTKRAVTFHRVGRYLLEEVYRNGRLQFCVYNLETRDFEFRDTFTLPGLPVEYIPYPCTSLIEKNFMFLPSEPREYGSTQDLVNTMQDRLHRNVDYEKEYERLDPYYTLLTWQYDLFPNIPYRRALSPDSGVGKTRWLEVMITMCRYGYKMGAAVTPAVLFRLCDMIRGTAMIDETLFSAKTEQGQAILLILNSGYSKATGVVYRCDENNVPIPYVTYGPKLIAARRKFGDDATESRTISHDAYETDRDDIPTLLGNGFYREALSIRNMLLQWRFDNYREDIQYDQYFDALKLSPRLKEIMLPLISIINDQTVRTNLIETAKEINRQLIDARAFDLERSIIKAVAILWKETKPDPITVKKVAFTVREIEKMEEKDFSPRKCGWYLRERLRLRVTRARIRTSPYCIERNKVNLIKLNRLLRRYDIRKEEIGPA